MKKLIPIVLLLALAGGGFYVLNLQGGGSAGFTKPIAQIPPTRQVQHGLKVSGVASALRFAPQGARLWAVSGELHMKDLRSPSALVDESIFSLADQGFASNFTALAIGPEGQVIAGGVIDRPDGPRPQVLSFDYAKGEPKILRRTLVLEGEEIRGLDCAGGAVALATDSGLRRWSYAALFNPGLEFGPPPETAVLPESEGLDAIVLSADGKTVAGLKGGALKLWGPEGPAKAVSLSGAASALCAADDGFAVAVGNELLLIDAAGEQSGALKTGHSAAIAGIAVQGDRVASLDERERFILQDKAGKRLAELPALKLNKDKNSSVRIAFSAAGSLVTVARRDGFIQVFDAAGKLLRGAGGHFATDPKDPAFSNLVLDGLVSGDGKTVVSLGSDVAVWDAETGALRTRQSGAGDTRELGAGALSHDGKTLYTALAPIDGPARLYRRDLGSGKTEELPSLKNKIWELYNFNGSLHPDRDDKALYFVSEVGVWRVDLAPKAEPVSLYQGKTADLLGRSARVLGAEGKAFFAGVYDRGIIKVDTQSGKILAEYDFGCDGPEPALSIALLGKNELLAYDPRADKAVVLKTADLTKLRDFSGLRAFELREPRERRLRQAVTIAGSRDGGAFALNDNTGLRRVITFFDAKTGKPIAQPVGLESRPGALGDIPAAALDPTNSAAELQYIGADMRVGALAGPRSFACFDLSLGRVLVYELK